MEDAEREQGGHLERQGVDEVPGRGHRGVDHVDGVALDRDLGAVVAGVAQAGDRGVEREGMGGDFDFGEDFDVQRLRMGDEGGDVLFAVGAA